MKIIHLIAIFMFCLYLNNSTPSPSPVLKRQEEYEQTMVASGTNKF